MSQSVEMNPQEDTKRIEMFQIALFFKFKNEIFPDFVDQKSQKENL